MNIDRSELRLIFLSAALASCSNQGAGQLLVKKKTTEPTTVTETVYVDRQAPETSAPSQGAGNETNPDEPSSSTEVDLDESTRPQTQLATRVQLVQQVEENPAGSTQLECVIVSDLSFDARFERVAWRWFRDTAIVPGWTSDTVQVPRDMTQKTFSCAARLLNDSDPSRSSPWSQPSAPWDGREWFQSLGTDTLTGGNSAGLGSPNPEAPAEATPSPEPLQGPDSEVISDQSPPTSASVLTCRRTQHQVSLAPGQTELFRWYINSSEATELSSPTLSAPHLTPGSSISCSTRLAHPTEASLTSQWGMPATPIVIAIPAPPPLPSGPAAEISTSETPVYPTATLTCGRAAPADALSPGQSEEFRWYRNGTLETGATGASVSGSLLSAGSSLTCSIRLVHAGDASPQTQWGAQSNPVTVQALPGPSVTLTAADSPPTVESALTCALDELQTDPNVTVEWRWHKDGLLMTGVSSASLSIFELEKDATFNCSARLVWSGGITLTSLWGASSGSLLIRNSTPVLAAPTVTPDEDVTLDTVLTCNSGTPTDPDAADAAHLTIEKDWLRNGVSLALASDTLDLGSLNPLSIGDSLSCRTRVTDGTDTSAFHSAPAVSVTNRAPSIADPADTSVDEGTEAALTLPLIDADGDALSYACVSGCPAGVSFSGSAPQVRWTPGYADAGVYPMTLRVSDGTATQDVGWQLTVNAVTDASLALIGSSDFGIVHHDGTAPLTLTLQNSGVAPATNVNLSSLSAPFSFGAGSTCNTSSAFVLAGGTSCTVELEFSPAHIASFTQTLGVSYHNSETTVSFDRTVDAQVRLVVEPVYPANGSRWTDWVRFQDEGFSIVEQPGNSCRGVTEDEENACIHGGEMRKVVVPGETSSAQT